MSSNIDERNNMPLQTPAAAVLVKEQPVLLETMGMEALPGILAFKRRLSETCKN